MIIQVREQVVFAGVSVWQPWVRVGSYRAPCSQQDFARLAASILLERLGAQVRLQQQCWHHECYPGEDYCMGEPRDYCRPVYSTEPPLDMNDPEWTYVAPHTESASQCSASA